MNLTRESAIWWALLVLSLVSALATLNDSAVAALGIPVVTLPYIRLVAFLTATGSAWAKTSPFPSKHDAP